MSDQQPPTEPPIEPSGAGGTPPPTDPANPEGDSPWYGSRTALVALIAFALVAIFLLVGWLLWWSDDDTIDSAVIIDSSTIPIASTIPDGSIVDGVTIPMASTIPDGSIVDGVTIPTIDVTLPPETTAAPTTAPATTAPATTTPPTTAPAQSMMEAIVANPDLSRLNELITTAGLEAYVETNPLSLFAPNDTAIGDYETANGQIDTPEKVEALLKGHGVEDLVDDTAIVGPSMYATTAGSMLNIENSVVSVDGVDPPVEANIAPGVDVANGFLYVIDKVLTTSAP